MQSPAKQRDASIATGVSSTKIACPAGNWRSPLGNARIACRATEGIGKWLQQGGGFANTVGRHRAVNFEPVALKYVALAVNRKVIGVSGACAAPLGPRSPATC